MIYILSLTNFIFYLNYKINKYNTVIALLFEIDEEQIVDKVLLIA